VKRYAAVNSDGYPRRVAEQRPWAVRITVLATDAELDGIVDRIGEVICSPHDHSGPCSNPWYIVSTPVDDLEPGQRSAWLWTVDEVLDQRRLEREA
jgi:hypothetical protein